MLERIKALIANRQLTPSQFADQTNLPRPVVSHILSGRNKPSLEAVQKILAAYPDVSVDWLLNGRGAMEVGKGSPAAAPQERDTTEPARSARRPRQQRAVSNPVFDDDRGSEGPLMPSAVQHQTPDAVVEHKMSQGMLSGSAGSRQAARPERVVKRILVFYSDGTFSDHRPLAPEDNPFL